MFLWPMFLHEIVTTMARFRITIRTIEDQITHALVVYSNCNRRQSVLSPNFELSWNSMTYEAFCRNVVFQDTNMTPIINNNPLHPIYHITQLTLSMMQHFLLVVDTAGVLQILLFRRLIIAQFEYSKTVLNTRIRCSCLATQAYFEFVFGGDLEVNFLGFFSRGRLMILSVILDVLTRCFWIFLRLACREMF